MIPIFSPLPICRDVAFERSRTCRGVALERRRTCPVDLSRRRPSAKAEALERSGKTPTSTSCRASPSCRATLSRRNEMEEEAPGRRRKPFQATVGAWSKGCAFKKQIPISTTVGRAWQQLIASLVFETKCDLSLIEYFDEQDQARLFNILDAFMSKELRVKEVRSVYLEFFQHPEDWEEPQEN